MKISVDVAVYNVKKRNQRLTGNYKLLNATNC